MTSDTFLQDHFSSCMKNKLLGNKSGSRDSVRGLVQ